MCACITALRAARHGSSGGARRSDTDYSRTKPAFRNFRLPWYPDDYRATWFYSTLGSARARLCNRFCSAFASHVILRFDTCARHAHGSASGSLTSQIEIIRAKYANEIEESTVRSGCPVVGPSRPSPCPGLREFLRTAGFDDEIEIGVALSLTRVRFTYRTAESFTIIESTTFHGHAIFTLQEGIRRRGSLSACMCGHSTLWGHLR